MTVVVSPALLSPSAGSKRVPATWVWKLSGAPALPGTATTIVTWALAPTARLPIEQLGTPFGSWLQPVVDTSVVPDGRVLASATPVAASGPWLVTVTV